MSQLLDTLASYVPWLIAQRFVHNPTPLVEPTAERFPAAVFFADISGFTKLSSEFAKRSSDGAELLTRVLNTYFGALIDLIQGHGGDIVKFAGDGLYAIWPTTAHHEDLGTMIHRAAQCSLLIQKQLDNYPVTPDHALSMRIGLGAGEVLTAAVGGVLKRWEFLIAGQPIGQINLASDIATAGEVVVSPEAWELLKGFSYGEPVRNDFVKLLDIQQSIRPRLLTPVVLPAAAEEAIEGFVPKAILDKVEAGMSAWLAENRRVTVLFVNITGLNHNSPNMLERLQEMMQAMQVTLYHFEGSVRQFIVDDKGTVFIAAFGLPPRTHEDDPVRGVQAALAIHVKLRELELESSIGVATGMTFCGPVGNQLRREYAMVGDIVFLAARLMGAANHSILCDEATYQAARLRLKFTSLNAIRVKNRSAPVSIYSPRGRAQAENSLRPIIGRENERAILSHQLQVLQHAQSSTVIIQGETGIGKTRLIADLIEQAEAQRVEVLLGEADSVDRTTPYHGWRGVLSKMFHMDSFTQTRSRSLAIIARLAADSELSRLAPLLNAILPLDIPENEFTSPMSGEVRAENTRHLLLRLLEINNTKSPSVIILENAHWLDSASWALALTISQYLTSTLLVIVMRPPPAPILEVEQLREQTKTAFIELGPLTSNETMNLILQRLSVASIPKSVATLIQEKAEGNAFFIEQLTDDLADSGYLQTTDGECRIATGMGDLRDINLPDTIQGIITSRLDRLSAQELLTLKVASVFGPSIPFRALQDVYPLASEKGHLRKNLDFLIKRGHLQLEMPEPDLAYHFNHIITQDVAYNLMLSSQRRELHEAIARWYERNFVYDLSPFYSFLAHHWSKAENPNKAIDYLEKAALHAFRGGAFREVINFLNDATTLAPVSTTNSRIIRWSIYAGEAHWGLGQLQASRLEAEKVLNLLNSPMPNTPQATRAGILRQALRQIRHRLQIKKDTSQPIKSASSELQAVRAYRRLQEIFYFLNELSPAIYAGLKGINVAEATAPASLEMASAYANAYVGLGAMRLHRVAKLYIKLAQDTTQRLNDPAATAIVSGRLGLYYASSGQWKAARNHFEQAIHLYETLNDRRGLGDSITALAIAEYQHGYFKVSEHWYQELLKVSTNSNNLEHLAWAYNGQGSIALIQGLFDRAVDLLESSQDLLRQTEDHIALIDTQGLLAYGYFMQGKHQQAEALAQTVLEITRKKRPVGHATLGGYHTIPTIFLGLYLQSCDQRYLKLAESGLRQLKLYGKIFPIGKPHYLLINGQYLWHHKQPHQALKQWEQGIKLSEAMDMPYLKGLAHLMLGRHSNPHHRQQAQHIFEHLGAAEPPPLFNE
ncbi:MAG: AAA family ATPase [Anaerolineales bacterium]|nr:AAA family ATPase [Anaerolineales bacterium]